MTRPILTALLSTATIVALPLVAPWWLLVSLGAVLAGTLVVGGVRRLVR